MQPHYGLKVWSHQATLVTAPIAPPSLTSQKPLDRSIDDQKGGRQLQTRRKRQALRDGRPSGRAWRTAALGSTNSCACTICPVIPGRCIRAGPVKYEHRLFYSFAQAGVDGFRVRGQSPRPGVTGVTKLRGLAAGGWSPRAVRPRVCRTWPARRRCAFRSARRDDRCTNRTSRCVGCRG
jgi:hypothetical protein